MKFGLNIPPKWKFGLCDCRERENTKALIEKTHLLVSWSISTKKLDFSKPLLNVILLTRKLGVFYILSNDILRCNS